MSKRNREKRLRPKPAAAKPPPRMIPWWVVIVVGLAFLLGASFVVPRLLEGDDAAMGAAGDGPEVGAVIPFRERDVVTGGEISSRTSRGQRTLLFFSEGIMCQACFEQIRDIEEVSGELRRKGIQLVSITPDSSRVLREAIDSYDIDTPMISDEDRYMSAAFDTLGQGMHSDTPGHAFVLVDGRGRVQWQRDYWLEPYRTMYVEPEELLADLPDL